MSHDKYLHLFSAVAAQAGPFRTSSSQKISCRGQLRGRERTGAGATLLLDSRWLARPMHREPERTAPRRLKRRLLDVAGEPMFHAAAMSLRNVTGCGHRTGMDGVDQGRRQCARSRSEIPLRFDPIRNSIALVLALAALPGAAASDIVDAHVLEINSTIRFKDVQAAGQVKGTLLGLGGQAPQVR